jgi:hypothetical protein
MNPYEQIVEARVGGHPLPPAGLDNGTGNRVEFSLELRREFKNVASRKYQVNENKID